MGRAIGFGVFVIVLAIVLPEVLQALKALLLTVLTLSNEVVVGLANSGQTLIR